MVHIISKYLFYGLMIIGIITVIKRALNEESKVIDYGGYDILFACFILALMYFSW